MDYLAFSFHKMLAPFGVGVLYAKEHLLEQGLPFLYGGDMIAEGQVAPDRVAYNVLPWKYAAGTPNILGVIVSAQALRLLLDLVTGGRYRWFRSAQPIPRDVVVWSMDLVAQHTRVVTEQALRRLYEIAGLTVYGPALGMPRSPLLAFNVAGTDPLWIAEQLNLLGVESRAGCHCATLAHRELGMTPAASCRLSFAPYTNLDDVERAVAALRYVAGRTRPRDSAIRRRSPRAS